MTVSWLIAEVPLYCLCYTAAQRSGACADPFPLLPSASTAGSSLVQCLLHFVLLHTSCSFIMEKYKGPDDSRIWLFGLDKGAYTVRAVAG